MPLISLQPGTIVNTDGIASAALSMTGDTLTVDMASGNRFVVHRDAAKRIDPAEIARDIRNFKQFGRTF